MRASGASGGADVPPDQVLGLPARLVLVLTPWLSSLGLAGLNPVLAAVGVHFAETPGAGSLVRLMVTIVGGAMIVGAPAGGFLAERFGARRVLMWALGLFAIAGAAGFVLDHPYALLGTRILLGFALGTLGVCAATLVTTRLPGGERDRWLGFYTTSGTVGALFVLPVTGVLGGIDWRLVFLLHLFALPLLLAVGLTVSRGEPPARPDAGASPIAASGFRFPWGLVIVAIACGAIGTTVPVYLPFHLAELGETSPERIAGAMLPTAAATGLVSLFYGAVRRRLGVAQVFAIAFLVSAAGIACVVVAPDYATVLVGMGISGLGMGLLAPNLFSASAAAAPPARRARTIGIVRAGFFGAPMLAQLPLEPVTAAHGPTVALAALAGFAVASTALVLLGRRSFAPAAAAG